MDDAPPRRGLLPRLLVGLGVVAALAAFLAVGPGESELLERQVEWKATVAENLMLAIVAFFLAEVILVAFSVPVATGLSILAGVLFGRWLGTAIISFASTLGALLAMWSVRYVLQDAVRRSVDARPRWRSMADRLDRGVERDGWYYLLLIRLTPVLPFFAINFFMGLTRMSARTYWWATQLGMLPITFLVVSAGAEVGEATSFRDLVRFERLWPAFLLVLVPIALRRLTRNYWRTEVV